MNMDKVNEQFAMVFNTDKGEEMNALEIANELEEKFGNEYAPKQFDVIKQAIIELRKQAKQIEELTK